MDTGTNYNKPERYRLTVTVKTKRLDTIRQRATEFIDRRLAPTIIANDSKQTSMRGHHVFIV